MSYYNYHARNLKRISNGELIDILPSEKEEFAFVLLFNSYPYTRPIRPHAVWRYGEALALLKDAPKKE